MSNIEGIKDLLSDLFYIIGRSYQDDNGSIYFIDVEILKNIDSSIKEGEKYEQIKVSFCYRGIKVLFYDCHGSVYYNEPFHGLIIKIDLDNISICGDQY